MENIRSKRRFENEIWSNKPLTETIEARTLLEWQFV